MQLSEGFLKNLYHNPHQPNPSQPILQLLDFQQSELNQKQLIIRISDGNTFLDCTLSGSYTIMHNKIINIKNQGFIFDRFCFIKICDFYSKFDNAKINKLKIMVRLIKNVDRGEKHDRFGLIGIPEEINQYFINKKQQKGDQNSNNTNGTQIKMAEQKQDKNYTNIKPFQHSIKLQNNPPPIILEDPNNYYPFQQQNWPTQQPYNNMNYSQPPFPKPKKEVDTPPSQDHNSDEPLHLLQILAGKEGFIVGRLIRFKTTIKETKDGIMTVCYVALLDKYGELIRLNLAGRIAMQNQKFLKKNKCYFVRGFDVVNLRNTGTQIRLKEKQYRIFQITNQQKTQHLGKEYYYWDHQHELAENEYVDVIGIIEDIQQKSTYKPQKNSQPREVIRIVLRNKYRSIKIGFWTDQIKHLETLNLKKKQPVIIMDVRKKQSKYYDFQFQSHFIRLESDPQLTDILIVVMPQKFYEMEPENVGQLGAIYDFDPNNNRLHTLTAKMNRLIQSKIVYKICDKCKHRVEKISATCQQCSSTDLHHKFNVPIEFSDYTGSLVGILFDNVAQKLLQKSALQVSEMSQQQIQSLVQQYYYKTYNITVQYRNQRIIVRNIEEGNQLENNMEKDLEKIKQFVKVGYW